MTQAFMGILGAATFTLMIWDIVYRKKKPDAFVISLMALFEVIWFVGHAVKYWPFS